MPKIFDELAESEEQRERELIEWFTGRREVLDNLEEKLAYPPGRSLPVLAHYGVGGIGKTELVSYVIAKICEQKDRLPSERRRRPYAAIDFRGGKHLVADSALAEMRDQLVNKFGFSFQRFDLVLATYREATGGPQTMANDKLLDNANWWGEARRTASQHLPIDVIGLLGLVQSEPWEIRGWLKTEPGYRRFRWHARTRSHPKWLLAMMPKAFAADLEENVGGPGIGRELRANKVMLFFDTYEALQESGDDGFVHNLAGNMQHGLVFICGRRRLDWPEHAQEEAVWARAENLEQHLIGVLDEEDSLAYLRRRGIEDEALGRRLHAFTTGHPMCLALAADLVRDERERDGAVTVDDFPRQAFDELLVTEFLIKRIIAGLPAEIEAGVWVSAVPRWFYAKVLGILLGDERMGLRACRQLGEYSFVARHLVGEGRERAYRVHSLVRGLLLRELEERQPLRFRELNAAALEYLNAAAEESNVPRSDSHNFAYQVEQVYHQWVLDEGKGYDLFDGLFRTHLVLHHLDECEQLLAAARERPVGGRRIELWLTLREAQLSQAQGRWGEARERLERLWAEPELGDRLTAAAAGALGSVLADLWKRDRAIEMYERSLETLKRLGDEHGMAVTWGNLGAVYVDGEEWDWAIVIYKRSLRILERLGDMRSMAQTCDDLGSAYLFNEDQRRAIEMYKRSLETKERLGDERGMAATHSKLAIVYGLQGDWDRAIEVYERSLETYERLGNALGMSATQGDLAWIHLWREGWDRAIEMHERSLETDEQLGNAFGMAATWGNLGFLYGRNSKGDRAIEMYERSLETYERLGDAFGMEVTHDALCLAYAEQGEWDRSIEMYERSLETYERLGDAFGMAGIHFNMACVCALMGEAGEACKHLEKAIGLKGKYRAAARKDANFDGIRGEACFKALVNNEGKGEE